MSCVACMAGIHSMCFAPEGTRTDKIGICCCPPATVGDDLIASVRGPLKDAEDMKDPLSTGRKRAVNAKPITEGMLCEWTKLAKAGGGVIPIVGCTDNPAKHVHHGPDKDTTNNSENNLHRVCHVCHNRWHTLNDPFYGERPPAGTPFVPQGKEWSKHDPESTVDDFARYEHELWWSTKVNRPPYVNIRKDENGRGPAVTGAASEGNL